MLLTRDRQGASSAGAKLFIGKLSKHPTEKNCIHETKR